MATDTTTQQIVDVVTPAAGESVTEGTVLEWHVKVGEQIKVDATIVEISTDKVDVELPSPATGTVTEILVAEGDTVTVGQVIARIAVGSGPAPGASAQEGNGNGTAQAAPPSSEGNGAATAAPPAEAPPQAQPEEASGTVDVVTPGAGESVSEGTILEWHAKVGDPIKANDTIVEISTDKVDLELPSPATGTVSEILAAEGDTVTVGQVIARIALGAGAPAPAAEVTDGGAESAPAAAPAQAPDGTSVSPVAARAAAAEGVDLAKVEGSGRGGRITKSDVLGAAGGNGAASAAPAAGAGEAQPMRGGAAALARYMELSRSIPTATSFRTITVTTLDGRRRELKAGPRKVSFTHLIAYAIARAAEEMQVMTNHFEEIDGKPHRIVDGRVNLGLAVDVEKKDGSRTLMVPVITDAGKLGFAAFLDAYDALVEKARTNTLTADDLVGANITLTNPGGIGTIASVPRLMTGAGTIVATGSIAYPPGLGAIGATIGAEKVMTMTSTYDHRVIQGAESGRFLALVEEHLQGEHGFYEAVFEDIGVPLGAAPAQPAPAAAAAAAASAPAAAPAGEEMLQAVQAATTYVGRVRSHGHLAARLDPLGSEPEGDPGLDPEALGLDAGAAGADPSPPLPDVRPGRDARRRAAAPARDLLRDDRVRDRAHRLPPPARVAARAHRVGLVPPRADQRRAPHAAQAARRGRRARALHAQGLPRPAPVLDRGPGHDRADARRADPALRRPRRPGGRRRDGPPRPAERARPQPRPRIRHDLRRVRGRLHARGGDDDPPGRHRRREVPPRDAGHLPAP